MLSFTGYIVDITVTAQVHKYICSVFVVQLCRQLSLSQITLVLYCVFWLKKRTRKSNMSRQTFSLFICLGLKMMSQFFFVYFTIFYIRSMFLFYLKAFVKTSILLRYVLIISWYFYSDKFFLYLQYIVPSHMLCVPLLFRVFPHQQRLVSPKMSTTAPCPQNINSEISHNFCEHFVFSVH